MLALLLGALSLFAAAHAQAQTPIWSATLTVAAIPGGSVWGCTAPNQLCSPRLTSSSFTVGGTSYSIQAITAGSGSLYLQFSAAKNSALQALKFCVGSSAFDIADTTSSADAWSTSLTWATGDMVELSIGSSCTPQTTGTVTLSATPNPVDEGSSVTVTATLSPAPSSAVTIPLTLTANTAETGDYGTLSSITINAGSTTGTGMISANQDTDGGRRRPSRWRSAHCPPE